eukprot:Amastigsp_a397_245.p1 type:complete len:199 gc:universal Amastigsp_a397_245:42-638(+)
MVNAEREGVSMREVGVLQGASMLRRDLALRRAAPRRPSWVFAVAGDVMSSLPASCLGAGASRPSGCSPHIRLMMLASSPVAPGAATRLRCREPSSLRCDVGACSVSTLAFARRLRPPVSRATTALLCLTFSAAWSFDLPLEPQGPAKDAQSSASSNDSRARARPSTGSRSQFRVALDRVEWHGSGLASVREAACADSA